MVALIARAVRVMVARVTVVPARAAEVRDCMVICRGGWCTARVTQGSGKWGTWQASRSEDSLVAEQDLGVVDTPLRCGNLLCTVVPAGVIPPAWGG